MPLHYTRDGYTFQADAHTLAIMPGPKPITLTRAELEQLGLLFRDDYQIQHMNKDATEESVVEAIMNSLTDAMTRCRDQNDAGMRRNLQRAMVLAGGLEEEQVRKILDQEGL